MPGSESRDHLPGEDGIGGGIHHEDQVRGQAAVGGGVSVHFGVDRVSDRALHHQPAKRMADEDCVLPARSGGFTRCLGNGRDRVVTIEITREPFRGRFPAVERKLPNDRNGGALAAPSEIHADRMKAAVANELRLADLR